jgi:hypothetical protein
LQVRATGTQISDELLVSKAKQLAEIAKVNDFKGTNGWLEKFKKRFNIRSKFLHGDAADADMHGVEHSQRSMPALITELGYSKEDVYNFDETGLYFKAEPKRTLLRGKGAHPTQPRPALKTPIVGSQRAPHMCIARCAPTQCTELPPPPPLSQAQARRCAA